MTKIADKYFFSSLVLDRKDILLKEKYTDADLLKVISFCDNEVAL
jgi:hypothetical protein